MPTRRETYLRRSPQSGTWLEGRQGAATSLRLARHYGTSPARRDNHPRQGQVSRAQTAKSRVELRKPGQTSQPRFQSDRDEPAPHAIPRKCRPTAALPRLPPQGSEKRATVKVAATS